MQTQKSSGFFARHLHIPVVLLAFCGISSCNRPAAPVGAMPEPTQAIVTVYNWDEYLSEPLMKRFEEETGIHVEVVTYESTDEMLAGLKSEPGRFDVVLCEDGYLPTLTGKRLLRRLDRDRLPNWKNLDEKYLNKEFDPGNEFSTPYLWGTTLLAYRKDLLPDPPHSWDAIFQPELKNRVSFLDGRMECYAAILRHKGISRLDEATVADIEGAASTMTEMVQQNGLFFGGDNETKQFLLDGRAWIAMMYSGDAALIADENPEVPIGYFIPDEGATVWVDSFSISRDTTRLDNAYTFLNFMLDAQSAAESANDLHYASPNRAAKEFITAELLADETIYPKADVLAKCDFFSLRNVDSKQTLNAGWRRIQEEATKRTAVAEAGTEPAESPVN